MRSFSIRSTLMLLPAATFLLVLPLNHMMGLRLTSLFLAGAVAFWHWRRHPTPPIPLRAAFLLWVGVALLSVTWSFDPKFSLQEIKAEIGYGLLAFFIFYVLTQGEREWRLWLGMLISGLLATMAIAFFQVWHHPGGWTGYDWGWQHGYVSYSTYLVTIAPLLVYMLIKAGSWRFPHSLALLLLPLYLYIAYASTNRMLWISLACVIVVFAVSAWRHREAGLRPRTLFGLTAAGLLLVGTLLMVVTEHKPPVAGVAAPVPTDAADTVHAAFTKSERYMIWAYWIERIQERPFTGVGFGRDLPHFVYPKPPKWEVFFFAHAHNIFLDYALQMGLAGLAAFVFLFGSMARAFWRLARDQSREAALVGACGLALLAAVITKNLTDDLFWRTDALLFWALAGMLLGYGRRLAGSTDGR